MLDPMSADERTSATPGPLLGELVRTVPRLLDRTRSQAEMARSLVALVPCVGGLLGHRPLDVAPGVPEHERVDVLSVLAEEPDEVVDPLAERHSDDVPGADPQRPPAEADAVVAPAAPSESELPIQDYDSLAASQVVPRLATLVAEDLRIVQRYERATRNRQTILNRVDQLLAD